MLLQRKNGYLGLPSVFSHSSRRLRCGSGTESSSLSKRSSMRNRQSFASTGLGWRSTDKFLSPAKEVANGTSGSPELSCLRRPGREPGRESLSPADPHRDWSSTPQRGSGIGLSADAESSGGHFHSTVGRRHSLSRLPSHVSGALGPAQPLDEGRRSVSERDLRACLPERVQKEAELAVFLREADRTPREEVQELKKLEVDLNVMKFELLSLKQRMESSFDVLEKEKTWLETLSSGNRKWKWKRKEKIFPVKLELLKAKSYSQRKRNGLLFQDSSQNEDMGKKDVSQDMPALQEIQVALLDDVQALEEEQEATAQQMKSAAEGQRRVPGQTAEASQRGTNSPPANQASHEGMGRLQAAYESVSLNDTAISPPEERDWPSAQVMGLEGEGNEPVLKPKPAFSDTEGLLQIPGTEPGTSCVQSGGSSPEPQPPGMVPLDPEHAQKKQEASDVQVAALHADLVGARSQANRELSLEGAESHQSLEASSDSPCPSEAEKKALETRIQALENERAQLLGEREGRIPEGQPDRPNRETEFNALQVTCGNLRESQSLLQREKDLSETRCLEVEAALRGQWEEMERHLAEQKQVSQYWQDRWEQVAAALKAKEEELEEARLQSQASSAQLETPLLLQMQLDACKQELELERNRSQAPHHYIQHRESGSQTDAVPASETALQEVDTEVALVREELQKVWDTLKSRDTELEGTRLELETVRNQYAECSSEKRRLDRLVDSLEEQLAEKEQALRRLEEAGDGDRAEKEMRISFLEQKLAEMEAVQDLPRRGADTALETQEVPENRPGEDSRSQGACRHCSAALAQLNQAIQSAEKREKEDRTLACLYQLRDLLKGSLSDRAPVPKPVQSPSQDPPARSTQTPQEEREILRRRHQLVTDQLKGLFRQRQQLEQAKKQPGGGKEERLREPRKSQEVQAAPESTRPPEEQPDVPSRSAEVQRLQQLLKEKTETISSMASEIQALQQKNESLMKAKLRFQQQIQQIRNLPKQRPERSTLELLVPRLSATLGQDSHSAQGSDSSVPSPQSDEPPFTGSREDLSQAPFYSQPHAGAEDQRRGGSPDEGPRAPPSPPIPTRSSSKPFSLELIPSLPADSEGALASPRGSALLSPIPFGPPRPWSPFKFRGNPEIPEDGEKH